MTGPVRVRESTAHPRIEAVPLSHLSIEVGHFYFEDFTQGPDHLRRQFAAVAPWVDAARRIQAASTPARTSRVSTCFLVDDYFAPTASPANVIPQLLAAARENGLEIDYLARESACVDADGVPLARLVEERIVADPPPGSNGLRPPVSETGWLSNGQRSPSSDDSVAMAPDEAIWRPPTENAVYRHSVFIDVELWDTRGERRTWSCAFLAAVWQLLRLGLLRARGRAVAMPKRWDGDLPDQWDRLPAVIQLNPTAAPFCAYRSLSVLPGRFFATEHAVRTILSQVAVEAAVAEQIARRAQGEGIELPSEVVERLQYVFAP